MVAIMVMVAAGCWFAYWAVGQVMCRAYLFQEVYSPDGEYKAVIYQRDCGATTGFATNVSILKASDDLPNKIGNILNMDGHPDWTKVKAVWNSNDSLTITYAEGYAVYIQKTTFRRLFTQIDIEYRVVN
jgi:hypothetical protein